MLARSTASRHGDGRTCERDVDDREVAVAYEEVGRLDVPMGEPGVPHPPHDLQAFVDDRVVDLGVAELDRPVDERRDEHVLTFGRQLDDAHRLRGRDAGVAHQAQRVVLLLDEPAHRLERRLVLQPAVEHGAPELVPAVGAHVVHGVELPEQLAAVDGGEPQRRRSARAREPERRDLGDADPELLLHGVADGLAAPPGDVEVGRLAAPVLDRHDAVRSEPAECQQRDGDPEGQGDEDVEGVVDAEQQAAADDEGDGDAADDGADRARPPGHHEHRQDPDQDEGDDGDRHRRHRIAAPAAGGRHVERARAVQQLGQDHAGQLEHEQAPEEREHVAPPPQHHRGDEQCERDHAQRPPGRHPIDAAGHRHGPVGPDPGEPAQHRGVSLFGQLAGPAGHREQDHPHRHHHGPGDEHAAGGSDLAGERRGRPGRAAPPARRRRRPALGRRHDAHPTASSDRAARCRRTSRSTTAPTTTPPAAPHSTSSGAWAPT